MATFKFRVVELRAVECEYAVEADSFEEAQEKAGIGDTTMEVGSDSYDVINREIVAEVE
jgi:hypothetical protein